MRPALVLLFAAGCAGTESPGRPGLQPGEMAPNFVLANTNGEDIELSELQGQRLVVAGSSMW